MPSKSARKELTRTPVEIADDRNQRLFPPRQRTVLGVKGTLSTPRTRQQTLTQIDFITRGQNVEDDVDLAYEMEDDDTAERPHRLTKRRRIDDDISGNLVLDTDRRSRKTRRTSCLSNGYREVESNEPKTAKKASPARKDSKTKGRRSVRIKEDQAELTRTLREGPAKRNPRSKVKTNGSLAKGTDAQKLDNHNDSSVVVPRSARTIEISRASSQTAMPPPMTPKRQRRKVIPSSQSPPDSITPTQSPQRRGISRSPLHDLSHNARRLNPSLLLESSKVPKLEILDSFDTAETGSDISIQLPASRTETSFTRLDDLVVQESDLDLRHQSQKALKITKTEILDSEDEGDDLIIRDDGTDMGDYDNELAPALETQAASVHVSSPYSEKKTGAQRRTQVKSEPESQAPRPSSVGNYRSPWYHNTQLKAEEASSQLQGDISRAAQPMNTKIPSDPLALSEFMATERRQSAEQLESNYTLPPPRVRSTIQVPSSPIYRVPVPTSQATTVDASSEADAEFTPYTPKPLRALRNSSRKAQSGPPRALAQTSGNNRPVFRTPLPPPPNFSSSPTQSKRIIWDGRPMTDSQMLPDSLMDFELPMIWATQESLEEEERDT